jgi:DNA-binding MarR family transcriptional regulator
LDLYGATSKSVRAATDLALRRHGLRLGQDHLLAQLWEQDGRTPGEIARAVGVSTPAVTKTATVLGKQGLLVRRADNRDNRLVRLWLTDAGRALQPAVEREREAVEAALTAELSGVERKHLTSALNKINRAAAALGAQHSSVT